MDGRTLLEITDEDLSGKTFQAPTIHVFFFWGGVQVDSRNLGFGFECSVVHVYGHF